MIVVDLSVTPVVLIIVILVAAIGVCAESARVELVFFLYVLFVTAFFLFARLVELVFALLGLVFLDGLRLLTVECSAVDVPLLLYVPVAPQLQCLGVVVHFLGL